jgi:uncharacterized protein YkwD
MGIADRDYMRSSTRPGSNRRSIAGIAALLLLVTILVLPATRHWLQERFGSNRPFVFTYKPLGLGPTFTSGQPYPINDAWKGFLPSPSSCAGSTSEPSATTTAERSMICVLNFARTRDGLRALPVSLELNRSSRLKALDIIRCQQFSHEACGRDARAVADAVGYPQVTWGENIYEGSGPFMPARVAADGWLNSPHHRENLFRPQWTEQGIAVVVADQFKGQRNVAIWVSEFGERR